MLKFGHGLMITAILLLSWQGAVVFFQPPPYLLPAPLDIAFRLLQNPTLLLTHSAITFYEIIVGLLIGGSFAIIMALTMVLYPRMAPWALPLLVGSQALPVFALAPLLSLWLGFGMASKIAMAALIIYFPIISALYDGLKESDETSMKLARTLGANDRQLLFSLRLPAALPALSKGIKIAAVTAPIGAVVGEWVGASQGLGYLMLHANGRMQTDLMFAALFILVIMGLGLYGLANFIGHRLNLFLLR